MMKRKVFDFLVLYLFLLLLLVRAISTTDATGATSCKWSTAAAAAALPLQWSTVSRKRENSSATSEAGSCRKIGVLGQQTDNDIGSN